MSKSYYFLMSLLTGILLSAGTMAQQKIDDAMLKAFEYRNMGSHRVSAWVSDIAVPETDDPAYRYTWYIAARHGEVWKTDNNGVTYRPIFDDYGTNSIGALGVAPSEWFFLILGAQKSSVTSTEVNDTGWFG